MLSMDIQIFATKKSFEISGGFTLRSPDAAILSLQSIYTPDSTSTPEKKNLKMGFSLKKRRFPWFPGLVLSHHLQVPSC